MVEAGTNNEAESHLPNSAQKGMRTTGGGNAAHQLFTDLGP